MNSIAYVLLPAALGILQAAEVPSGSLPSGKSDPSLSPDGVQVAFAWNGGQKKNFDIYVQKLCYWPIVSCKGPQSPPRRLTTNAADDFGPAWSPDGRQIAFCRRAQGAVHVLLVDVNGGGERKVAESAARRPSLTWTGDGRSLAMIDTASPKGPSAVFLLAAASGAKRRLTNPPAGIPGDDNPAVSPDGKTLAFTRSSGGGSSGIFLQALGDGLAPAGDAQRLGPASEALRGRTIHGLGWTPDNGSLVAAAGGLWRIPVSGGAPVQLGGDHDDVRTLSVARQGRRVVFAEIVPEMELWRTAGPTSQPADFPPMRLIGSPEDVGSPNISWDGSRIAFGSVMSGTWEIWKCNKDGSNPVQLTFLGEIATGSPRWSPDGKYVVFDGRGPGNRLHDIHVVGAEGGPVRHLTDDAAADIRPCYSRDQRWIYFSSDRTGTFQIWKMPAEGGKATQVTKGGGRIAFETMDGKFLYYGKGPGQNTLWRVPTGGGEEVKVLDDVNASSFTVSGPGIGILNLQTKSSPAIEFFSFATQKRTRLPVLPDKAAALMSGTSMNLSRDGRWLVYVQHGRPGSGLHALEY